MILKWCCTCISVTVYLVFTEIYNNERATNQHWHDESYIKPNKIVILHVLILIYVFYDNECAILYCSDFVQGVWAILSYCLKYNQYRINDSWIATIIWSTGKLQVYKEFDYTNR